MRILSLIAVVLFVSSLAAPARAGMVEDCEQEYDPDLRIGGCTAVIDAGQHSGWNLVVAYYNRGLAHHRLGDPARAIEDYDQALRLDPSYAPAHNNRGNAYGNLGDPARAIEDYDQALRLDPDNAVLYNNRGKAYDNLGEYRQAIQDFDQALRIDPGSTVADNNRAIALGHLYKSGETKPRRRHPTAGRQ
jgi:tetratricopeptide (TPR) repeat protein